jgi:hypothetical protein
MTHPLGGLPEDMRDALLGLDEVVIELRADIALNPQDWPVERQRAVVDEISRRLADTRAVLTEWDWPGDDR